MKTSLAPALLATLLFFAPSAPALVAQEDLCHLLWRQLIFDGSPNSPGARTGQAAAFDVQRQVTVLFGGQNSLTGVAPTSETWEWNGATWTLRNSGQALARKEAAMAYDSVRGVCVMFGGGINVFQNETPYNDTWEWNGSVWTQRQGNDAAATDRPPPLEGAMMAYDSARRRVVLLGGSVHIGSDFSPVTRTWEWDGNRWWVSETAPPPRLDAAMAYDPVRRVTVVFGGTSYSSNAYLYDTWTWDGSTWKLAVVSAAPVPRDQHAMAFDERRGVLVLVGGFIGNIEAPLNDTFEWNGSAWTYIPGADFRGLTGRRGHIMWYETGEQRLMIFGGTVSRRNTDGSYTHTIHDEVFEGRPPGNWVDYAYLGQPESGVFGTPFNTLGEAVAAANPGCTIILKTGSGDEALTITKALTFESYHGPATIH